MNKKIIAAIGTGLLVAGGAAGAVYIITRSQDEEVVATATSGVINSTSSNEIADGKNKITSGGTYTFTGSTTSGKIVIDTTEEVRIILNDVSITNPEGAAIKCREGSNVTIELVGENTLTSTDKGSSSDNPAGAISSDGDLTITGSGSATITSNGDGIHADGKLQVISGTLNITSSEGLEATYIVINGGNISISASDDGINASNKSDAYSVAVEINGGVINISMGQGDTDAIDTNGDLYINDGTINITAQSPFDYDGTGKYNGGTITVNGEVTTKLTNQFMGGAGGVMAPQQPQQPSQQQQNTRNTRMY